VGQRKRRKLTELALWSLQEMKLADASARFDVIVITLLPAGNEIKLIKNAFDSARL